MKIKKVKKLVVNFHDKKYIIHIRNLKQTLNYGLVLKSLWFSFIKCNQRSWLKLYIHMNTELRKKAKKLLEKDFLKLMNNSVFW